VASISTPPFAAGEIDYTKADKKWAKGPVRWLLTRDEQKAYKKLKSDDERARFVQDFWAQRDPTPGTPLNEYEIIFWARVDQANQNFTMAAVNKPGALTDMGRVLLLLGSPATTKKDSRYSYWIYEPNETTGIKEHLELRFAPQQTGPILLDKKPLEEYVEAHPESRGIGWQAPAPVRAAGVLQLAADEAKEPEEDLSPESQRQIPILEGIMNRGIGPEDIPFEVRFEHYATAGRTTLVSITVETPREAAHGGGDAALRFFARLEPESPDGRQINITGERPFVPAPTTDHSPDGYIYQARRNVAPGSYEVVMVVEDQIIPGTLGSSVTKVDVPDFAQQKFDTSTISLLSKFTQLEASLGPDDADGPPAGPFVLGSFRLVPRATPVLGKDEALAFYFQIYNPALDPASDRPSLEVTYAFYLRSEGAWKRFRKPLVKTVGQVELYTIDLKDLLVPNQVLPAEFRMEIALQDKLGGEGLKRELRFTVR
jgi:GWxTD domain-containing protein